MAILLILTALFIYLFVRPVVIHLYDPKNLRKYPNLNNLSGFTTLAYVWEHMHSFRTRRLYNKHREHPIIRVSPNALSFADVRAIKDIYGHGTPCRKDDVYTLTMGSHPHMLNVVDQEDHARKRRMLSHAFATRNLQQWEFKISDKVEKLVTQFDKRCTSPLSGNKLIKSEDLSLNFRLWSNLFTIDAIADIALSEKLGMLDAGTDTVMVDGLDGTQSLKYIESMHCGNRITSSFVGATDWFAILRGASSLFSPYMRLQWEYGRNFGKIVSGLARKRLKRHHDGTDMSDFLAYLIEDKSGHARDLDHGEIEAETSILLDAGSDTTAVALTHVLYYLIKNPHSLTTLRKEVDEVLSGEAVAPYAKVKNLPYLKACLDESLRLSPPVSRGLERRTPPEGMQILGEEIAGDIGVSVPTYVAHRDPVIFRNPETYLPERWFEGEEMVKQMRTAFMPFSTGARACIGRNISLIEQQIVIATLVYRYEFALASEDWRLEWEEAFNLWPGQMPLKIWRKEK